jgi:hypothetical protein
MSDPSLASQAFAYDPIGKHKSGCSGQDTGGPVEPFLIKSYVFHHLDYGGMLNCVRGFCEVQLNYDSLLLGLVALMNVFKGPY